MAYRSIPVSRTSIRIRHLSVSVHKNNTRTYTVGIGLVELYMSFLKIATSVGVLSFLMLSSFTIMGFFDRLGTYGLAESQIEGGGNCQV